MGSKKKKWILSILAVIVLMSVVSALYVYSKLGSVKKVPISKDDKELKIDKKAESYGDDVINIAFFGLDRRKKEEPSRSDAVMILSLDKKHKKVKLSSIMRDSYVDIEGHGKTKLNHAYAYGGPELAIKTINSNFKLNIRDFVAVDFYGLENIIDTVGGVEIPVRSDEIKYINSYMQGTAKVENKAVQEVQNPGLQNLNGMQAVAYARIRYTSGGDYERTERQRTILTAVMNKIKKLGPTEFPKVVSVLLPNVESSLSSTEIIKMGTSVFALGIDNVEQQRFPLDNYCEGKLIDGIYYLLFNKEKTIDQMYKYIFEDIKPN
ncbi:LCP family protein [Clostridium botulinum]|uniref:LytR-family transcriptional regulator n=1 Tax=Clostridium botulinum (strain Hall / ATCC 3502 / NCTC 13319 / Type A) TaxID=441771 RepID=A5I5C4_CLOBH|nr:LCP family protein [Clostridium botulinum]ABS33501.1 cell envelope-related transcriptional attenuator domain protein [Clostridium botulinum A str. ATCC 19397]ABS36134.1 cell envelope-related transcriptional attenuator domain protein [Clostridium botulinum A str. Hall]APQ72757.1 cell envelope-related function transcriptional attenuator common domain protein [Clostridium botulinum]AWB18478.1 LytR family transcriptional regulator [Clostridium botulinum]AWB31251.1 LytR family transcriptional re